MKKISKMAKVVALVVAGAVMLASCSNSAGGGSGSGTGGNSGGGGGKSSIPTSTCIDSEWVLISKGSFQMGSTSINASINEKTVHQVTLSSYLICDHEVTQSEYERYCKYSKSTPDITYGKGENFPAYFVTWYDAIVYCNLRSIAESLTPCYKLGTETDPKKWAGIQKDNETNPQKYCGPANDNTSWNGITCDFSANGYRLPTEAEWECAARGGIADTDKDVWAGTTDSSEENLKKYMWYGYNADETHEVKGKSVNGYGLYDMSGNVSEWCWDLYGNYNSDARTDPTGAVSGSNRVKRGGNWTADAIYCRASYRYSYSPQSRGSSLGFRLARSRQ